MVAVSLKKKKKRKQNTKEKQPEGQQTEPDKKTHLAIVSSTQNSPYFDQIWNYFIDLNTTLQKVKVADLTVDTINAFTEKGGYQIILALDTPTEFNDVGTLINNSNYNREATFIECTEILSDGVQLIRDKVSDVLTIASGVNIQGILDGLNATIPYERCAASLTLTWKCWSLFKRGRIIIKPE